ncbi:ribokinase [Ruminiclostridium hungatei]|uniref:Ribokinase n=1 Tax=Ruminiclostridium hungatei TaxID=48256 RepID=A0A1V4SFR9_RUMHU|nr:ribokinase [Ruminiclostridium hungatei]OPX42117.1 ribokinase [Ruminiclostridium hungatei]
MANRITVVGSLNIDMVVTTPRLPVLGETILGSGFMTTPGGKGANQAVAAARLGGNVSMIGCTGDDIFGNSLLSNLAVNHVDIEHVKVIPSVSSGVAMIMVKDGDNSIIVDPGANFMLTPEMIDSAEEEIKRSDVVVIQLEIPLPAVERAVDLAKKHGAIVLLNPAPARELPDVLLSRIDIFTPNESECETLTGMKADSIGAAKDAAVFLASKGITHPIITLGGSGAVYGNAGKIFHRPAPEVEVVDTTAAGDCFSAAVALALSRGKNIAEAVEFGNIAGALTVTRKGAQASLPTPSQIAALEEKMKNKL